MNVGGYIQTDVQQMCEGVKLIHCAYGRAQWRCFLNAS